MQPKGFTLIELLVSTAIFAVVMVIALGALLAMSESDRQAQLLKAVINNLNFSLDSMSRSMRTGFAFHCGSPSGGDCQAVPSTYFAYTDVNGNNVAYCLNGSAIMREVKPAAGVLDSSCAAAGFLAVTAPEVTISTLSFYVLGSTPGDTLQPKVTIMITGTVQASNGRQSSFNLQTSATQRLYDQ